MTSIETPELLVNLQVAARPHDELRSTSKRAFFRRDRIFPISWTNSLVSLELFMIMQRYA